jgi:hypothetical protein
MCRVVRAGFESHSLHIFLNIMRHLSLSCKLLVKVRSLEPFQRSQDILHLRILLDSLLDVYCTSEVILW